MIDYKDSTWAIQIKNTKERLGGINFQVNTSGDMLTINPGVQAEPDVY